MMFYDDLCLKSIHGFFVGAYLRSFSGHFCTNHISTTPKKKHPSENFVTNIFSFSSSPPNEGGVFAWWCGAGPELDHLYQFVSDYSHQVIVQLTYQQTAKQDGLPRANYFCHRMLISNEDGYRWKIYQPFKGALKMRHSMLQTLGM